MTGIADTHVILTEEENDREGLDVAVIGMAGRFPGANNIDEFWENLKNGVESLVFPDDEWLRSHGVPAGLLENPAYVKAMGGVMEDADCFDAGFFGYTPMEARIMDPQMRIFHQCAWHALEDAGYAPGDYNGSIGLYAGAAPNLNWEGLVTLSGQAELLGAYAAAQLSNKDYLTLKIAYNLNLKGPVLTMNTACSTSLVAIHLAVQAILNGECHMALAGGIRVTYNREGGYIYQEGTVYSPDGHCRAFDADAGGTVGGDGAAIVVLKSFEDALRDKDRIYAVIRGSAVNNDGRRKAGFTAPSVDGQSDVIRQAMEVAEIEAQSIGYLETHGTGTPLGDPIEIEALRNSFNTDEKGFCPIGSVKTNVGHLDAAAGAAGLIKAVLALYHGLIPESLHFKCANPELGLENSPFFVNNSLRQWPRGPKVRRAGVSSFGIGGVNAHVVLQEAPLTTQTHNNTNRTADGKYRLLVLSAKSEAALERNIQNLAGHLKKYPDLDLSSIADTLQTGRKAFPHRNILAVKSAQDALKVLTSPDREGLLGFTLPSKKQLSQVVFMFSGQGSQYIDMGLGLYRAEPVFSQTLDRCLNILEPLMGAGIKGVLFPGKSTSGANIDETRFTQPLLFAFEYSLAALLMNWGIRPHAMIGHSIGEYVAACLAGVFSLEDALTLVVKRGELMQSMPPGAMAGVALPEQELMTQLPPELSVAAVNGPSACTVSGPHDILEQWILKLEQKKVECKPLHTSHAFHSAMMEPMLDEFRLHLSRVSTGKPTLPFISNVSGTWITEKQAQSPEYWVDHVRHTVRFAGGIRALMRKEGEDARKLFLEVGPGKVLTTLARACAGKVEGHYFVNPVRHPKENSPDHAYLMEKLGQLWLFGADIDWEKLYGNHRPYRVSLPGYAFERQAFNISIDEQAAPRGQALKKNSDRDRWFYVPVWKQFPSSYQTGADGVEAKSWLIFAPSGGAGTDIATGLREQLTKNCQAMVTVRKGEEFAEIEPGNYSLRPGEEDDYRRLFSVLKEKDLLPHHILHLWSMESQGIDQDINTGFFSVYFVARAIINSSISHSVHLDVVSNGIHAITPGEEPRSTSAMLLGPLMVLPQEYPGISCRNIDVLADSPVSAGQNHLLRQVLAELSNTPDAGFTQLAYRGHHRWRRVYENRLKNTEVVEDNVPNRLKQKGVYLITGGLGRLGLVLARYLYDRVGARLILTSRHVDGNTPLPPEVEEMGDNVLVLAADAADETAMERVFVSAQERFGSIDGVIHAAGLASGNSLATLDRLSMVECRQQFRAKVLGTMVLEKLLRHRPVDFCLLTSSLSAILGGMNFGAYAAANIFMDAVANGYFSSLGPDSPWITVNWDGWSFGAEGADAGLSITPAESGPVLDRVFRQDYFHLVISTGHLDTRLGEWVEKKPEVRESASLLPRPSLVTPFIAPATALEEEMTRVWENFFGFNVGVRDDFFELGGDSLKASTLVSRIHQVMNIRVPLAQMFDTPFIRDLCADISDADQDTFQSIPAIEKREYYDLTHSQKRLWILDQFEEQQLAYILPVFYQFKGQMDPAVLSNVMDALAQRHESLRTTFITVKGEPKQRVYDYEDWPFKLETILLTGDEAANGSAMRDMAQKEAITPFVLSRGPLLRATLVHDNQQRFLFMFTMHHIISDGWSIEVLTDEVFTLYDAFSGGQENPLPPLAIQFKDYAAWQNDELGGAGMAAHESFWLEQFKDSPPILELITDYPRPRVKNYNGSGVGFALEGPVAEGLNRLSRERGASLFMVLLASVNLLLYRYTYQEDIVIGTPAAERGHVDLAGQIGFYLNTLAIRGRFSGARGFGALLEQVKQVTLDTYEHQAYPFDLLVEKLDLNRDMSRTALFDILIVLQNTRVEPETGKAMDGVAGGRYMVEAEVSKFDLTFNFRETGPSIQVGITYNTGLFRPERIERMARHFRGLVDALLQQPDLPLIYLDYLAEEEKRNLLLEWCGREGDYTMDVSIQDQVEKAVQHYPDRVALVWGEKGGEKGDRLMSYRCLSELSSRWARCLETRMSVQPGDRIGVALKKSGYTVAALLAILKCGAVFVTMEPGYPSARLAYIYQDAACRLVLSEPGLFDERADTFSFHAVTLEELRRESGKMEEKILKKPGYSAPGVASSPAYVIYTSGSTGNPKGVMIEHRNFVNFVRGLIQQIPVDDGWRFILTASITFDASFRQIFHPLYLGGQLHIPEEVRDIPLLVNYLRDKRINVVSGTPTLWREMVKQMETGAVPRDIKLVFAGGEVMPPELANSIGNHLDRPVFINLYGSTETTVLSLSKIIEGEQTPGIPIDLGTPLPNYRCCLLDQALNPVPDGVAGEICVAGAGLARGYMNAPAATDNAFVEIGGRYWYRSGDLAVRMMDGRVRFLGRIDRQVKVRGIRVEPAEIEAALLSNEDVKEVLVAPVENNGRGEGLAAYYSTISGGGVDVKTLREFLRWELPGHMVPSYFIEIETFPTTASGKTDVRALPAPDLGDTSTVYVPPANPVEEELVKIWRTVLKREQIGVMENFFDLGGDSLKAIHFLYEVNRRPELKGKTTPLLKDLFLNPTVREFSGFVTGLGVLDGIEPGARVDYFSVNMQLPARYTLICFPPLFGFAFKYLILKDLIAHPLHLFNMITETGDARAIRDVKHLMEEFVRQIRLIKNTGPLILIGWSAGGRLIFEICKELELQGIPVNRLIMIDSSRQVKPVGDERVEEILSERRSFLTEAAVPIAEVDEAIKRTRQFFHFYRTVKHEGTVNADIMMIASELVHMTEMGRPTEPTPNLVTEDSKDMVGSKYWGDFTNGTFQLHTGAGYHGDMLQEGYVEENARIINNVIFGGKSYCSSKNNKS